LTTPTRPPPRMASLRRPGRRAVTSPLCAADRHVSRRPDRPSRVTIPWCEPR
jgi:hypothetical protein